MNIELVTHVDPVILDDVQTNLLEDKVASSVAKMGDRWTIQDFRIEKRTRRTHIFFDLVVPYEEKKTAEEIAEAIRQTFDSPEKYKIELRLVHPFS